MEIRSFLAFELPSQITNFLSRLSAEMKRSRLDVRWVEAVNIHLTVVFLGNTPTKEIPSIEEAAGSVCRDYRSFQTLLKGMGVFGDKRNPRVLWIGLEGDLDRMSLLRDDLQKKLAPFGIKTENRPFRPHLTLGRFRKGARSSAELDALLTQHRALSSPTFTLAELVLFRSELKPGGAVYTRLNAWPLVGRDSS